MQINTTAKARKREGDSHRDSGNHWAANEAYFQASIEFVVHALYMESLGKNPGRAAALYLSVAKFIRMLKQRITEHPPSRFAELTKAVVSALLASVLTRRSNLAQNKSKVMTALEHSVKAQRVPHNIDPGTCSRVCHASVELFESLAQGRSTRRAAQDFIHRHASDMIPSFSPSSSRLLLTMASGSLLADLPYALRPLESLWGELRRLRRLAPKASKSDSKTT